MQSLEAGDSRESVFMNEVAPEAKEEKPQYCEYIKPKNKRCLVFRSNGSYAKGIGLTLLAIQEYQDLDKLDVIIYHIDWEPADLEAIKKIKPDAFFINPSCEKIFEETKISFEENFVKRYGVMQLLHYELVFLLDRYEQILCLDSDLIICGNIDGIFNAKKGMALRCGLIFVSYQNKKLPRGNGGVILYNNTISYEDFSRSFLRHLADSDWFEECAIAKACHDLKITVEELDHSYNMGPATIDSIPITSDIVIYHATGRKKIWNSTRLLLMFPEYRKFIKRWIELGGSFSFEDYDHEFPIERSRQIQILNNTGKYLRLLNFLSDIFAKDYKISFPEVLQNNILIKMKFSRNYFQIKSIRYYMIFRFYLKIIKPVTPEEKLRELATGSWHFHIWGPNVCGFYFDFAIDEIYKIKEFMKYYNEKIRIYLV